MTADEYVMYCGTHGDHMMIPEPYRIGFYDGLRKSVAVAGNKIVFLDTYVLFLTNKSM